MNALVASLLVSTGLVSADPSLDAAVVSYEHLSTVIIEVRKTEDQVVNTILRRHYAAAAEHFKAAGAQASGRGKHLEEAAAEITNIANEGDKRVQAIRQRLAKAGHTHNTDADTKEDYMFIDSKEKKALLALAKKVAQLGDKATTADVTSAAKELGTAFDKAMAAE
jgi:hypothetical protein